MATPLARPAFTTIGVPIDSVGLGRAEPHGTELSPDAIRAAGLARLGLGGSRATSTCGSRTTSATRPPAWSGIDGVLETTDAVRGAVADLVREGGRPFVLGGCCTLLSGALAGRA